MIDPDPVIGSHSLEYYDVYNSPNKCFLQAPMHIFYPVCSAHYDTVEYEEITIDPLDKISWICIEESVRSFLAIQPTLLGFVLAHLLGQRLPLKSLQRFLLEFLLIAVPTVLFSTVANEYCDLYSGLVTLAIVWYIFRSRFWQEGFFVRNLGKRPQVFTLLRANTYVGTCAAILAVDFDAYPKEYRKSRSYGAAVMDMGIGMFVVTMGLVSHRARQWKDLKMLPKVVVPLLVLGLARTVVISLIKYNQDEHEYGQHLNAFFILGFTKLFGSLFSLLARTDRQLLYWALGLLFLHELLLQMGLAELVLKKSVSRESFLNSNREGLSSLPGCMALYLLSIWFAKWYTSQNNWSYKLKKLLLWVALGWAIVFLCAYKLGIARVIFSAGYVIWIATLCASLILIYAFLFELVFAKKAEEPAKQLLLGDGHQKEASTSLPNQLPVFAEALNMNGLVYFLLSNFLTGFVNMVMEPSERDNMECLIILSLYMLANAGFVYVLYRKRIRIA